MEARLVLHMATYSRFSQAGPGAQCCVSKWDLKKHNNKMQHPGVSPSEIPVL